MATTTVSNLQVLADFIETLGKNGIYTILDCHQDLWSPKFCGMRLISIFQKFEIIAVKLV